MTVTLSSKGQLVIPKEIRRALALKPGTKFEVTLDNQQIVFAPVVADLEKNNFAILDALYGCLAEGNALDLLERERRQERARDEQFGL
jgi:AbrB family looped-hinge helix DNA binding protein